MQPRALTFLTNQVGNVAVMFALCLVPIGALIAFSIDFEIASSNKSRIQVVVDAAAVSGARARLNGARGTELRKDLTALIEMQTASMPSVTCETPDIIDAWWVHEVTIEINCWSSPTGPAKKGPSAMTFSIEATGHYGSGRVFSAPSSR